MSNASDAASKAAELLRRVPDDWADVPEDVEGDLLTALTAAGFVARRIHFTVKLPGCDELADITIELTGEYGFVEAMKAAVQDWWARHGHHWQELRRDIGEPVRPIVNRHRDAWRLTPDGRAARADLEQGSSVPIDFALKRGFFDGRPRTLPDGRVTQRLPVRGSGRLVKVENATGSLSVALTNWAEGAEAFAKAFVSREQAGAKQSEGAPRRRRRGRTLADDATVQREAEIAAKWARARDTKVYKGVFARDYGMSVKQLDALLDRVRKRKRRSE